MNTPKTVRIRDTAEQASALRLCIASESFYPVYAGPAVRFSRYLPGFLERGLDPLVFTGTPDQVRTDLTEGSAEWADCEEGTILPEVRVRGVPVHRICLPREGAGRRARRFGEGLVDFCRQPTHRPDVIQFLSLHFFTLPSLWRLRRLGIPMIFTRTMLPRLPDSALRRAVLRRWVSWPSKLMDRVVVSSGVMRDGLEELGVGTPITVIPNGVDDERFRPPRTEGERTEIRDRLGISPDAFVILFVGPVEHRKGVDLLLEAWGQVAPERADVHLVVVGPRMDARDEAAAAFGARLEELLAASGAADRVHFVGLVDDVERYMRGSDLFLFTSRREGMPNVVPEAMATALPVVTTPFRGLPEEFGRPGQHYVLGRFDGADLARRVDDLIDERERREALGRAGRRLVEETMSVRSSLDRYASLYRELAAARR